MEKIVKTEEEWKAQLTEEEYLIARQAGTERPLRVSTGTQKLLEHTGVNVATRLYLTPIQNLMRGAAGRVSLRRLTRAQ